VLVLTDSAPFQVGSSSLVGFAKQTASVRVCPERSGPSWGALIKHEKSIRLGTAVDGLCAQINEAFTNPFTTADSQHEMYISAVYVFNSGRITEEAKDDLLRRLGRATYGENVFFLDGERLDSINRWAGYQNDRSLRERLFGLRGQTQINIGIWKGTKKHFEAEDAPIEIRSALMHGMDEFISQPMLLDVIDYDNVIVMRQWAGAIDNISAWIVRSAVNTTALKHAHADVVMKTCEGAIQCAHKLIAQLDEALERLRPL
jgi:hypothetical protein